MWGAETRLGASSPAAGCVLIIAVPITKLFACVGGEHWRTCATRMDQYMLVSEREGFV